MGAALLPLALGGASLAGTAVSGVLQSSAASAQRAWEERMANTQYQRGTADMLKAGLNPALMYGSAGPAPTPAGATAQVPDFGSAVSSGVSSAIGALRAKADINNVNADTARKILEFEINRSGSDVGGGEFVRYRDQILRATRDNVASAAALNWAGVPAAKVLGSKAGGYVRMFTGGSGVVNSAARAAEVMPW